MLRKIRIILATVFFIGITLLLLDTSGALVKILGWLARLQFLPAVMAMNLGIIIFVLLLTLVFGGRMAIYGEITLGQFVAFNSYVAMLVWPMIAVGESVSNFSQGMASLRRIREILDAEPDIRDEGDPAITSLKGDIVFDRLRFSYPGVPESRPTLEDISVQVGRGETLAVVGRTGCGKTTLMNLLVRLWEPEIPEMIRIDGRPLREIPL